MAGMINNITQFEVCRNCGEMFPVTIDGQRECLECLHTNYPAIKNPVVCSWCDNWAEEDECVFDRYSGDYVCPNCSYEQEYPCYSASEPRKWIYPHER